MPFQEYSPEQVALLPVHVRDVLSEKHLVFLISAMVEKQDLSEWESAYGDEGQRPYHPSLLLKVLLYGFALGVRSSRKLEQRVREDLGFRYLAAGAEPDHKTICEFLRRHGRRVNDLFTAVLEQLQAAGLGKLGVVALDSTRVKANASRDRVITETGLRAERARKRRQVRKWEREVAAMETDENPGGVVAELERVRPKKVLADAGFYSNQNLEAMEERGVELYVPDPVLAREMKQGQRVLGAARICHRGLQRVRQRLRSPAGRKLYERRKGLIEPVFGTLKEHRGMRRFYRRGLAGVSTEFLLMALAFNLTRVHRIQQR